MTYREHLRIVKLMAERDCYRECLDKLRSAVMGRDVTARGMGDKQLHKATDEAVDAVRTRLMPEGMEWPRYEDGETFIPGDDRSVEFFVDGIFSVWINDDHQHLRPGERVKRPQVLAADDERRELVRRASKHREEARRDRWFARRYGDPYSEVMAEKHERKAFELERAAMELVGGSENGD